MLHLFAAVVVANGNATAAGTNMPRDVVRLAKYEGCALLCQQFTTLFTKRFHYVRRSKKAFFTQVAQFVKVEMCLKLYCCKS